MFGGDCPLAGGITPANHIDASQLLVRVGAEKDLPGGSTNSGQVQKNRDWLLNGDVVSLLVLFEVN